MEELGEFSRSEGALIHTGVWNYPLSAVPHFCTVSQWFYLCRKADNVVFFFLPAQSLAILLQPPQKCLIFSSIKIIA